MMELGTPGAAAKPLAGKTALVTGAAKRIGLAIALALADAGADIAITYRSSGTEAEEALHLLQERGVKASAQACNLDLEDQIVEAVDRIVDRHTTIDLLVNNAGTFASAGLEDISAEQWDLMFAANHARSIPDGQGCASVSP